MGSRDQSDRAKNGKGNPETTPPLTPRPQGTLMDEKANARVTLPPVWRPPRSRPPKASSSRPLKQLVGPQQTPRSCPPKARYSRLLKQPVGPWQAPTTIHAGNQTMVNNVCPLGRESPQSTQHCNIRSQRSHRISPIDTIWRRICGAHLTTIFSVAYVCQERFAPVCTKRGRHTDERTTAAHRPVGDAPT